MGNENSASNKNSVSSLPPISINGVGRKSEMVRMARRSSDQRQHQVYNHHQINSANNNQLPPHRHSTSNTHLNSVGNPHLEPQRKYSQCQPGRYVEDLSRQTQRQISDSQCSLSASPSAYSYRNRASFASVGPTLIHSASHSPVPPSASPRHSNQFGQFYANSPYPLNQQHPNRRMSVDESQQRRQARTASATPSSNGQTKLSLAGLHNLNISNGTSDDHSSNRPKINKSARDLGDGGESLQEQLKLTSYQTLMLTQTWPRIKSSVFNGVFRELSQKCPKVKELFQKTSIVGGFSAAKCVDMKEHIKQLVELYDLSLQELTGPCKNVKEKCTQIGETHFAIAGPSASGIWDDFGVCLTEAISKADAVRGKREAFKAYIVLTSFLVDSMKAGYMAQSKRKSLSRVNGQAQNIR